MLKRLFLQSKRSWSRLRGEYRKKEIAQLHTQIRWNWNRIFSIFIDYHLLIGKTDIRKNLVSKISSPSPERSMRCLRSTVIPYAVIMNLISEAIMLRAASMPRTCCIWVTEKMRESERKRRIYRRKRQEQDEEIEMKKERRKRRGSEEATERERERETEI